MILMCYSLVALYFSFLVVENHAVLQTIQNANLEEFPYQAQIVTSEGTTCSAIIISKYYVMTPATCIVEASSAKVFVGTKTKATHFSKNILYTRGYNSTHFFFNGGDSTYRDFKYDIGLVKLSKPLEFSTIVQKANIMWNDVLLESNTTLQISGWYSSSTKFDMKKMQVKLASEILCDYCYNVGETHKVISCFEHPESNYLDYLGNIVEFNGNVLGYITPARNGGKCSKLMPFLNIASFSHWIEAKTGINGNTNEIDIRMINY